MGNTESKPKMRVVEEHECKATEGDNNQIGIQHMNNADYARMINGLKN